VGALIEAEAPLLEMVLVGAAAGVSVAAVWFRQRLSGLRTAFGFGPGAAPGRAGSGGDRLGADRRVAERIATERPVAPGRTAGWAGAEPAPVLDVVRLRLQDCDPDEWDAFAQACGCSFRSGYSWLRAWSLKWRFRYRLHVLELRASGRRIGRCAVGVGARERLFLDRLQLAPDAQAMAGETARETAREHAREVSAERSQELWAEAMAAVLAHLGPGTYRYGWQLNLEPCRAAALHRLAGVAVETVQPLTVQAVDFRQWPSWDAYWKSTSNNTRRNAKRADAEGLRIEVRRGVASLRHAVPLVRLRSLMYERKGIRFQAARVLASYVAAYLASPRYTLTSIVADDTQALAGFSGMEFGPHTYYIDGGSRPANKGAAWALQRSMLQRAWERHPGQATFVMGYVDYATHDDAVGGGLLRSRKAVRASDYNTSVVTFTVTQTHKGMAG
jgi:hypothetical protein